MLILIKYLPKSLHLMPACNILFIFSQNYDDLDEMVTKEKLNLSTKSRLAHFS